MADPLAKALVDYPGPTFDQKMAEIMPSKPNPTGWETDHGAVDQYNIVQGLLTDMSFQEQLDSKTKMVDLFQKMLPNMERSQVVENLPMLYQSITGQQHADSVNPLERMGQVLDNTWKSGSAEFSNWMQEKTDNMVKGFQGLEQVAGQGAIGGQTGSRLISQLGMENTSAQAATKTKVDALKGYVEKTSVDHGGQWWLPIVDNTAMFVGSMAQMLPEGVAGGLVAGPVGAAIGAWDASARLQAASSYKTMRDRGVSFELADTAATTIGQAAAVLDVFEIGAAARLVLKPLLHESINQSSRTLAQKLLNYGGEYALTVGAGTAEEVAQEAISIAGENSAYQAQNKYQTRGQTTFEKQITAAQITGDTLRGYLSSAINTHNEQSLIPLDTPDEIAKRLADTAVSAAIGMAVLGAAGLGSGITARAIRNAWDKHQNKKDFAQFIQNVGVTMKAADEIAKAAPTKAPADGIAVYFAGHPDNLDAVAQGLELHTDPATAQARGQDSVTGPLEQQSFLAQLSRFHPAVVDMAKDVLANGPDAAVKYLGENSPVRQWEKDSIVADTQHFSANDIIDLADSIRTGTPLANRNEIMQSYGLEQALPVAKITQGVISLADIVDVASQKEVAKAFKDGAKAVRVGDRIFIRDASVMTVTAHNESSASVAAKNPVGELTFTANGNTIIARNKDLAEVGRLTHEPTALGSRISDVHVSEQYRRQGVATSLVNYHRANFVGQQVEFAPTSADGIALRDKIRWANAGRFMTGLHKAEAAGNQMAAAYYASKVDKVTRDGEVGSLSTDELRSVLMTGTTMDAQEIEHVAAIIGRMSQRAGSRRDEFLETLVQSVDGILDDTGQLRDTANGVARLIDGLRGIEIASKRSDVTTIVHEAFHVLRPMLSKEDQETLLTWTGEMTWTVKAEELAARGFEKRIMEDHEHGAVVDTILDKLKGWFRIIYDEVVGVSTLVATADGKQYAVDLNDAARSVYDKILGAQVNEAPAMGQSTEALYQYVGWEAADREAGDGTGPLWEGNHRAIQMESEGRSPEDILVETGWFRNKADNKWRFEIPDSPDDVSLDNLTLGKEYALSEVYHNRKILELYPELGSITVIKTDLGENYHGRYSPMTNALLISPNASETTFFHELQHAIQTIERFALGSNKEVAGSYQAYYDTPGEVEARDVESRLYMAKRSNRRKVLPYSSQEKYGAFNEQQDWSLIRKTQDRSLDFYRGNIPDSAVLIGRRNALLSKDKSERLAASILLAITERRNSQSGIYDDHGTAASVHGVKGMVLNQDFDTWYGGFDKAKVADRLHSLLTESEGKQVEIKFKIGFFGNRYSELFSEDSTDKKYPQAVNKVVLQPDEIQENAVAFAKDRINASDLREFPFLESQRWKPDELAKSINAMEEGPKKNNLKKIILGIEDPIMGGGAKPVGRAKSSSDGILGFHGSKYGIKTINPEKGYIGPTFFTNSKEIANQFSKGMTPTGPNNEFEENVGSFANKIFTAKLDIKNPITKHTTLEDVLGDEEAQRIRTEVEDKELRLDAQPFSSSMDDDSDMSILAHLYAQFPGYKKIIQESGSDGWIFNDLESGGTTIVPMRWDQVSLQKNVGGEFPYVLEGAHRVPALAELGIKSVPAMVVVDLDKANGLFSEDAPAAQLDAVRARYEGTPDGAYVTYDKTADPQFDSEGNESSGPDYVLIEKVFVPQKYRGRGVGKAIIKNAIHDIMNGPDRDLPIRLAALPFGEGKMSMDELVAFYETLGFAEEPYTEGMDAVVMSYEGGDPGFTKIVSPDYLKAPNGADTKLTEQQWLTVRTVAFKRWFGDWENDPANASKVVDENGEPLVVWHGGKSGIDSFNTIQFTGRKRFYRGEIGTWFGNKSVADHFASRSNGSVYATFLNLKNPKMFDLFSELESDTSKRKSAHSYRKDLQSDGYDGIVINESSTDTGEWRSDFVAFDPTQIKSATGNSGAFDPSNPSILFTEDAGFLGQANKMAMGKRYKGQRDFKAEIQAKVLGQQKKEGYRFILTDIEKDLRDTAGAMKKALEEQQRANKVVDKLTEAIPGKEAELADANQKNAAKNTELAAKGKETKAETAIMRDAKAWLDKFRPQLEPALDAKKLADAEAKRLGTLNNELEKEYERSFNRLVEIGFADSVEAMKTNALAIGWYDLKIRHALAALALIHPEIATDKAKKGAFLWALAVTSNGLKVRDNFPLAEKAYNRYMATGKMPGDIGIGTAANAINDSLLKYNELVEKFGADELADLMLMELKASQVTKLFGTKVTGEAADETVLGAAVIGPKIGNGFYANLNGIFNQLTMDRWFIRTWGRWTGTLITERPEMVAAGKIEMAKLIEELRGDEGALSELKKLKISLNLNEAKSFMEADLKQLQDDLKALTDKTSETHQKIDKMATDAYRKGQLTRFEKLGDGIPAKKEKVAAAEKVLKDFAGDESTEAGAKQKKVLVKALMKAQADLDGLQARIKEGFDADQAAKVQEQELYIERRLSSIPLEIASIESAMDMVVNEPEAYLATMVHKASIDSDTRSQLNDVRLASEAGVVNEESSDEEDASEAPLTGTIGNRLRLAGNGLWKYLDGQKEAPGGPVERQVVRRVAREVLKRLHAQNLNLTMADFQALLWYAEKNLYETLGMEPGKAAVYNEADAPDYANAARLLASNAGKTDKEIQEAIDAADQRAQVLSADGRSGDAGSGDQSQPGVENGKGMGRGQSFGERTASLREKYSLFSEDSLEVDVLSQQLDAARLELASLEDSKTLDKRIDAQARQSSAPREQIAREFRKRAETLRANIATDEQALATLRSAAASRPTREDVQKTALQKAVEAGKIVPTSQLQMFATEPWAAAELERRETLKDLITESLKYDDIDAWLEAAKDEAALANPDYDPFTDTSPELTPEDRATYKAAYLAARMKDAAEFDKDFVASIDEAKAREIFAKLGTDEASMQAHRMPRFVKAVALKLATGKEIDPKELARSITAMKKNPRPYRQQVWQYSENGQVDELLLEALAVEKVMEAAAIEFTPPSVEVKPLDLDPDLDFKLAAELRMSNESKNYWQQRSVKQEQVERDLKKEVAGLEKVVDTKLEKIDQQKAKTAEAKATARKLDGRLDTANARVDDLKGENKALKKFSSRLWVALEIKKNQIVSLEETKAEFEDALNSARQEADATAAGYREEIAALEKFSSRLWKALEKTKAEARNNEAWLDLYVQSYKDAVAQSKIELEEQRKALKAAEKERRAIHAKFQQMRDMAAYIARPVPKTIHVDYAQAIERMRAKIDPHFRREDKLKMKAADILWYQMHPEEKINLTAKQENDLNTQSLNLWSFDELEAEYEQRKFLEANGRFKLNYKMELRKVRIDRIKREILGAVYKDWEAFNAQVAASEDDLRRETDELKKQELRLKISTSIRQRDQTLVNAGQADDQRGRGGDMQALIFTLANMADILDGGKDYKGPNVEMLWKVPNQAENEFLTQKLRRVDAMFAWLKENKIPTRDLFKRIAVPESNSTWTVDALMDIYIGVKNEKKAIAIVFGNKVDQVVIRFAQQAPELEWMRSMGDRILAEYEDNQQRLFDAIAENENIVPGYETNYSPMARAEIDLEAMDEQIKYEQGMATAVRAASVEKGFSISRLDIPAEFQKPIKLGAWTQWLEQVVRQEQYITYAPVVKDLKSIYLSSEVKNAIEQSRGSGYWHEIDTYINVLANRYWGKSFTAFDRVMGRLQSNSAVAFMSYNMSTALKQIPALVTFIGHASPHLLVKNFMLLPYTIKLANSKAPQQKGRVERFGFIAIDQGKKKTAIGRWIYEISHLGMMPMQLVDKMITATGWGACYETAIAKGMVEKDALEYADFVVDQTQQAGHPKAVAGAYRNQNALLRTLLMFTGPSNKIFNVLTYGNWQALSKGRYLKSFGITVGIAVSMVIFWSIGKGQLPETEEDWLLALGAGMVEILPIIGPSLAALIRGYNQGQAPAQQVVQNLSDTVKYTTKAIDAKDTEVAAKNAWRAAQAGLEAAGVSFSVPVTMPVRIFRAVGTGNATEILGWRTKE